MPKPANDPIDPDAIGGGSEAGLQRARTVLRWAIVGALAVALALFYVLSASAEELTGKVVRVADGDTITVLDSGNKQHKIRLMGIDAPEKGQAFGNKSRDSLASMVAGRNVTVEWHKRDRYGRLVGQVFADSHDVGLVQIERGMAWHYKAYEREQRPEHAQAYAGAEVESKAARRGLWADPKPMPPWEWRKINRVTG
jgi:endonuclease YncB( thermonuclease family)